MQTVNNNNTKLSVMMFVEWFIWGAWFVPLWQYLNKLGFSPSEIAWSYSSTAIAAILSPVLVGVIADRYFAAQKVLGWLHLVGGALMLLLAWQTQFSTFFPLLVVYALTYMPTVALTNSIAFANIRDTEKDFPRIRVLGTLGWIASGLVVGFMLPPLLGMDNVSDTNMPLIVTALASVLLGLYSFMLPNTPPKVGQRTDIKDLLGLNALSLLRDRSFAIFALCSFLFCMPLAFYYQFANGYLTQVGLENATGWMTLGQVSEIFAMLALPFLLKRYGIKKVLLLGFVTAGIRYVLFIYGGTADVLMYSMLFIGILLHGVSYDFYFVTGYIYVDKKAPAHMRTAAQGLITLICQGFGSFIGNWLGGRAMTAFQLPEAHNGMTFDWFTVWGVGAAMVFAVMLLFILFFREKNREITQVAIGN
ncbi:MAG: nucleoside permease [Enterobacterales bacterium]|uniref:nucleoside permease n=1 Tax=Obesumbacterium proteus TaxID=82983 RepID=UPI001F359A11|nr:nucleoside permease [Obesumbacterium proteus]MDN6682978.1 nucleoside permease [Enterobacterales bacterium]MCE9885715.1 nucleoside permease [Obesumbacterium proteus]MCE9916290.1 nucleoside permease [Obesumbacterium proteus]MCE9929500.1 nucleoside permease [Obesumbacterium proteus]MCG2879448.1 nucleoside permease [Obesumbacterium proteus]